MISFEDYFIMSKRSSYYLQIDTERCTFDNRKVNYLDFVLKTIKFSLLQDQGVNLIKLFCSKITHTFLSARPFYEHKQYVMHCYEKA